MPQGFSLSIEPIDVIKDGGVLALIVVGPKNSDLRLNPSNHPVHRNGLRANHSMNAGTGYKPCGSSHCVSIPQSTAAKPSSGAQKPSPHNLPGILRTETVDYSVGKVLVIADRVEGVHRLVARTIRTRGWSALRLLLTLHVLVLHPTGEGSCQVHPTIETDPAELGEVLPELVELPVLPQRWLELRACYDPLGEVGAPTAEARVEDAHDVVAFCGGADLRKARRV